jgi:hypothetical protein
VIFISGTQHSGTFYSSRTGRGFHYTYAQRITTVNRSSMERGKEKLKKRKKIKKKKRVKGVICPI